MNSLANLEQNWREAAIRQSEVFNKQTFTFSCRTDVFLSTQGKANLPHGNDPGLFFFFFLSLKVNDTKASRAYIYDCEKLFKKISHVSLDYFIH